MPIIYAFLLQQLVHVSFCLPSLYSQPELHRQNMSDIKLHGWEAGGCMSTFTYILVVESGHPADCPLMTPLP
jgi:hypothetical protein